MAKFAFPLVIVAALAAAGFAFLTNDSILPPDDFVEYWAAGRLNLCGEDPYLGDNLTPLELSAGRSTHLPVMMWNPPWTLALAMPLGSMRPRPAQLAWLFANLGLVAASALMVWRHYGGPPVRRTLAVGLALVFMPTTQLASSGQIGGFMLFGAAAFIVARGSGRPVLAGAATALIAVKPHLAFLLWLAIALRFWREGRVILGGVTAGLLATGAALAFNPEVLGQYREALTRRPPEEFVSPTIGGVARHLFGDGGFWIQFPPMLLGVAWLAWRGPWRADWDWSRETPPILLASFVTAPYGAWPFDLVLLLVPMLQRAAQADASRRRDAMVVAACWFAGLEAIMFGVRALDLQTHWYFPIAPLILLGWWVVGGYARRGEQGVGP